MALLITEEKLLLRHFLSQWEAQSRIEVLPPPRIRISAIIEQNS
jgi:hypothetical protein